MKELPVKNIDEWNVMKKYRFFWRKINKKNPCFEEHFFFHYDIFHYFNRATHPEEMIKEGVEVKYNIHNGGRSAAIFNFLKNRFNEKITANK